MDRVRQIREVILVRKREERRSRLRTEETIVRYLAGSIHAAAGNARGVKGVQKFTLLLRETVAANPSTVASRFPADPAVGGMFTNEDVAARVAAIQAGA